jgi:hypothetical protein
MAEITIESKAPNGTVGTHVVNSTHTEAATQEINRPSVSKKLAKIGWSNAPLDTMLRNIGKGSTNSDKFEFFSVSARDVKCKVGGTNAVALATTAVDVPLSEGVHCLSKSGVLVVPTYNVSDKAAAVTKDGSAATNPLMLHIVDVDYSGNKIKVLPINATSGSLAAATEMYRSGIACDQDTAITDDPQAMPVKDYNYCQRFLCTISENAYQAMQDKDVEYGLNDFKEQAIFDFRLQSEAAAIFGGGAVAGENFIDPVTYKRKLHMRGVLDFGIQALPATSGEEIDAYLNRVMESLFSVNNGSEERILLYGAGFATKLANSKWWTKQLEANKTEMKWGVTWKMVESNFGRLRGIMDPALSLFGPYKNCALVIDPAHLRVVEQVPMQERKLDLQKAGIRNSHDVVLEESITLELTNPKAHGLLTIV